MNSWTVSLGFNALQQPFDDDDVRWAINHAINRPQLVAVGWQGSGNYSLLPFPDFPPMRRFTDSLDKLLEKYPVGVHDPALNPVGLWVDDLVAAVGWREEQGVRFTPGGIRKGASGYDVCFIHPKGNEESPVGGEGVLVELVQAPDEVISAFRTAAAGD